MAKTAKGVAERLKGLYQLQLIDSKIDAIQILKGELPIEVSDLEDEIVGLETRLNKLKDKIGEIDHEISSHNANIKESNMLIERYEKQLDEVKNKREYEALTKEIEMQRLEIQLSEKKIGDATTAKEAKTLTLDETTSRFDQKNENLQVKKVELEKIIAKTDAEEKKLQKLSEKARKDIEEKLLKPYDRIRARYRNGLAVVTVKRDSCGGCFNRIPPQLQIEIGTYKNIMACEHCGRVLVDTAITEEVEAASKL
ncbi:MAG: C4-type zinc ribbon domain-containing protein [Bacteroidota bacterium]